MRRVWSSVCFVLLLSLFLGVSVSSKKYNFEWSDQKQTSGVMTQAEDFVIARDGSIYVPDFGASPPVILVFNKTSLELLTTINVTTESGVESIFQFRNSNITGYPSGKFLLGTKGALYEAEEDDLQNIQLAVNYTTNFTTGINADDNYVYVSRMIEKVVLIYDRGNFTTPRHVIGPMTNYPLGDLFSPRSIALDCKGGFWLADSYSGRVFHYSSALSDYPDICIEYNMTTSSGVAMSHDCKYLFVSHNQGVIRYKEPFLNESTRDGFYDFFPDNQMEDRIFSLHFEDYQNGIGRLYIMIRQEKRLISGLTVLPFTFILNCASGSNSTCQLMGDLIVGDQVVHFNSTALTVTGNVILSNASQVLLASGQTITSLGNTVFAGMLTITLNNTPQEGSSANLTLFKYVVSSGQFSTINVISQSTLDSACKYETALNYGARTLSALVSKQCVEDRRSSEEDKQRRVIIGVVVGVGGCAILAVLVLVGIGVAAVAYRHRDRLVAARV